MEVSIPLFPINFSPLAIEDGPYQLFFVLRANIARILTEMGKSFWMIQQVKKIKMDWHLSGPILGHFLEAEFTSNWN